MKEENFFKRMIKDYTYILVALAVVIVGVLLVKGFSSVGEDIESSERTNKIQDALEKTDPDNRVFGN